MNIFTVLLSDGTVGSFRSDIEPSEGDQITVELGDENDTPIKVFGEVKDVLEAMTPWGERLWHDTNGYRKSVSDKAFTDTITTTVRY